MLILLIIKCKAMNYHPIYNRDCEKISIHINEISLYNI